jgi:RNA recognition motif-containing protein
MKNLFVGNLSFQTSESDLRTMFAPFGQIGRVHLPVDRETGRARGFAFVEMNNDDEAKKAMAALDGKEFGGRNVKVNEARPREQSGPPDRSRNSGGGGGGGRRGGGGGGGNNRRDSGSRDSYEGAARQPREPRW